MLNKKKVKLLLAKNKHTKEEINTIKEFLVECSNVYYNSENGEKLITDTDYDNFYKRYLDIGGKPFMGAEPEKGSHVIDAEHKYQELVGTTLKAPSIEDFVDWLKTIYKNLNLNKKNKLDLIVTLKFDGNSILIEYDKNGKVIKALTRGKNGKGLDKTRTFKNQKIHNPFNSPLAIKYEVLIYYSNLKKLNKGLKTDYVNPRSACGKLNADDSHLYVDYFTLEPLWMKIDSNNLENCFNAIDNTLELDKSWRAVELNYFASEFKDKADTTDYHYEVSGDFNSIISDIKEIYEEVIDYRESLEFMIDGLVIDVVNQEYREKLGFIDGGENLKPKWCIALKFPYMEEESVVEKIDFTMGDSGRVSPRCWFKPVKFNGGTHQKQYLQGYKRFNELQLCKGTRIRIEYHNDCLSYIERLDTIEDDKKAGRKPIPFLTNCPVCGKPLKIVSDSDGIGTSAYCINPECDGTVCGRINNFVKKMDIKGIALNTIKKMYEAKLWLKIEDLFTFNPEEAYLIEGLGEESVNKMVRTISKKKYYDYEIIASLGIGNLGLDTAKILCKSMELSKWLEWIDRRDKHDVLSMLLSIEGIAEIMAEKIYSGLVSHRKTINFLMERGYKTYQSELKFDKIRYTFVVTGDLNSCSREHMKKILEKRGHKLVGSVSSKTDYLITNTPMSGTVKNKKAKELGKPIITEQELIDLLQLTPEELN